MFCEGRAFAGFQGSLDQSFLPSEDRSLLTIYRDRLFCLLCHCVVIVVRENLTVCHRRNVVRATCGDMFGRQG